MKKKLLERIVVALLLVSIIVSPLTACKSKEDEQKITRSDVIGGFIADYLEQHGDKGMYIKDILVLLGYTIDTSRESGPDYSIDPKVSVLEAHSTGERELRVYYNNFKGITFEYYTDSLDAEHVAKYIQLDGEVDGGVKVYLWRGDEEYVSLDSEELKSALLRSCLVYAKHIRKNYGRANTDQKLFTAGNSCYTPDHLLYVADYDDLFIQIFSSNLVKPVLHGYAGLAKGKTVFNSFSHSCEDSDCSSMHIGRSKYNQLSVDYELGPAYKNEKVSCRIEPTSDGLLLNLALCTEKDKVLFDHEVLIHEDNSNLYEVGIFFLIYEDKENREDSQNFSLFLNNDERRGIYVSFLDYLIPYLFTIPVNPKGEEVDPEKTTWF